MERSISNIGNHNQTRLKQMKQKNNFVNIPCNNNNIERQQQPPQIYLPFYKINCDVIMETKY